MIRFIHVDWGTRRAIADARRVEISEYDAEGFLFRVTVTGGTPDIREVVQWWEHYLGPISMVQAIEVIP